MKTILSTILGVVLVGAASFSAAAETPGEIDVMTQNQYLGADLTAVFEAAMSDPPDPVAINNAVVESLGKIAARRPAERARALAAEIVQRNPDVVGLQEAFKFGCTPYPGVPPMPGMGCDDPAIKDAFTDHLQNTEAALRGKYVVAGKVTNLKVDEVPFTVNGYPALLSIADRDAILVRTNLLAQKVNFPCSKPSDDGCNYETAPPPFPTPVGPLAIERGFLAVDVTVKGWNYRLFNTHLEQRLLAPNQPDTRLLQVGQAYELLGAALTTWNRWDGLSKTVIVVGDINSDPSDMIPVPPYPEYLPWAPTLPVITPYAIFTPPYGTFTDAWTLRPHDNPGLTCCQAEDLANRRTESYERIDMIFSLPKPSHVLNMKLLGNTMGDKTRPPGNGGLWPSDHNGLAAKLKYN